ncbi:MAG: hypothetical protein R3F30_16560 [Planctomycetota bacterium]
MNPLDFWFLLQVLDEVKDLGGAMPTDVVSPTGELRTLGRDLDRLRLGCQAMFELMAERVGVTPDEFLAKVQEIDLRDGKRDGRSKPPARTCAACGKVMNRRHRQCLYCGAVQDRPPFEA